MALDAAYEQATLQFLSGSDPVTGTLSTPGGGETSFCGWMELIIALHQLFAVTSGRRGDPRQ